MLRRTRRLLASAPLTIAGWAIAAVGLACYIGGYLFGWMELTVIAVGCLVVGLLGALTVSGRMQVNMARIIEPAQVTVGDRAIATLSVTNPTRWAMRRLSVHDRVAGQVIPLNIGTVRPGSTEEVIYELPTSRRGIRQVGPAAVVRTDPLGLLQRERTSPDAPLLTYRVWPRRNRVPVSASGLVTDLDGPTSQSSPEGGLAFHAIREYVPGDDSRLIHWRTTARTGGRTLMVRQFVDNRRAQQLIALDIGADYSDERFESAVEIAASLVESCHLASLLSLLVVPDGQEPSHGFQRSMDRLAEVERPVEVDSNTDELGGLAKTIARLSNGAASVALVTGNRPTDEALTVMRRVPASAVDIIRVVDDRGLQHVVPRTRIFDVSSLAEFSRRWRPA